VRETESAADDAAVPKDSLYVVGTSAGGDVEVLGTQSEEQIANASADEIGLEARTLEATHDLGGVGVDLSFAKRNRVPHEAGVVVALLSGLARRLVVFNAKRREVWRGRE